MKAPLSNLKANLLVYGIILAVAYKAIVINRRMKVDFKKCTPRKKWNVAYRFVNFKWTQAEKTRSTIKLAVWKALEDNLATHYEKHLYLGSR